MKLVPHPISSKEQGDISIPYTESGAEYVTVPISPKTCPSLVDDIQKNTAEIITELANTVIAVELKRLLNMVKKEGNLREV